VQACEIDAANCVMTDQSGFAELDLPVDREIGFTLGKEGYGSQLRADVIPAAGAAVPTGLPTDVERGAHFDRLMSPYPMEGTGAIHVHVDHSPQTTDPIADATLKLLGTAGKPFYVDEDGNWRPSPDDLTATTSAGAGGFVELSPGEYEIEFGGAAENCEAIRAWPSDSENTIRVPVREANVTIARVDCD
jgi:hypothetical protein